MPKRKICLSEIKFPQRDNYRLTIAKNKRIIAKVARKARYAIVSWGKEDATRYQAACLAGF